MANRYETGNAVGSADPRDLFDNSIVIDEFANSESETAIDRLGQTRRTIVGLRADVAVAIGDAGYTGTGANGAVENYAAGIEITQYNQIVRDTNGEFWKVTGATSLPYTTTGAGLPEGGTFVSVGDFALRQDLADPAQGGGLVSVATATGEQTLVEALDDRSPLNITTASGLQTVEAAVGERSWIIDSDLIVTIPTDYPDIQSAIDALSTRSKGQGVTITIRIESGHALTKGVFLSNGDYGHFIIESVDATVSLAAGFTPANTGNSLAILQQCIFGGDNARLPVFNVLVDANLVGGVGCYIFNLSYGAVSGGKGVINADSFGLHVGQGSTCVATSANFSAARYGNRVTTNSNLNCPGANLSGCRESTYAGSGNTACLDISRGSVVNAASTGGSLLDCTGGANRGIAIRRSFATVQLSDVSNSGTIGLRVELGAHVHANSIIADSCGDYGVFCANSWVDIGASQVNNSGIYNVWANNGGFISAQFADLSICSDSTYCVRATAGSQILVNGSNCRRVSGVDNNGDIAVSTGSRIIANGAIGGRNQVVNQFNSAGYIIE